MLLAKLKPLLATVVALVLGAGTLAYCANGQSGAAGKPNTREFLKRHGLDRDVAASLQRLNGLSAGWDQEPAVPASGIDYAKIDRTLAKEPTYASKAPKYALLLFGPEAKLRVWIVLDGEVVYLDRNGNGDLADPKARFAKPSDYKDIEIPTPTARRATSSRPWGS
jgi:hypothetical protein